MPHQIYEFAVIDSKGRIVIPATIRKALNISDGMRIILIADLDNREIRIIPLADVYAEVYQLRIMMDDKPGVLAKVASILSENRVDLLLTESRTIKRGLSAEWNIIADFTECKIGADKLIDSIKKLDFVREVEVKKITLR